MAPTDGFPKWRRLRAIRHQAQDDLLSLWGAYATAIALGLAAEVFPDAEGARIWHRAWHGAAVVVVALAVMTAAEFIRRAATFRRRSRRTWTIEWRDFAGLIGFGVNSLDPAVDVPEHLMVVLRTPTGRFLRDVSHPDIIDGGGAVPYPPGDWFHIAEQPYESGEYEIRAYGTRRLYELTRATVTVEPVPNQTAR